MEISSMAMRLRCLSFGWEKRFCKNRFWMSLTRSHPPSNAGYVLDGHMSTKLQGIAFKSPRVAATGLGKKQLKPGELFCRPSTIRAGLPARSTRVCCQSADYGSGARHILDATPGGNGKRSSEAPHV